MKSQMKKNLEDSYKEETLRIIGIQKETHKQLAKEKAMGMSTAMFTK